MGSVSSSKHAFVGFSFPIWLWLFLHVLAVVWHEGITHLIVRPFLPWNAVDFKYIFLLHKVRYVVSNCALPQSLVDLPLSLHLPLLGDVRAGVLALEAEVQFLHGLRGDYVDGLPVREDTRYEEARSKGVDIREIEDHFFRQLVELEQPYGLSLDLHAFLLLGSGVEVGHALLGHGNWFRDDASVLDLFEELIVLFVGVDGVAVLATADEHFGLVGWLH